MGEVNKEELIKFLSAKTKDKSVILKLNSLSIQELYDLYESFIPGDMTDCLAEMYADESLTTKLGFFYPDPATYKDICDIADLYDDSWQVIVFKELIDFPTCSIRFHPELGSQRSYNIRYGKLVK